MGVREREHGAEIEDIYRRRHGKFLRVAVAILRDEQLGAEAVNDAFVRALRHRRGFVERGSLEAWLRIVVNEARRGRSIEKRTILSLRPMLESSPVAANGHHENGRLACRVSAKTRQRPTLPRLPERGEGSRSPVQFGSGQRVGRCS